MRDAQVLLAGHIGLIRRLAADHSDASNPDSASVRLHFFQVLSIIVDEVCEGLDDLLSLVGDMASENNDDDALQDSALQASLGLQHRQVVRAGATALNLVTTSILYQGACKRDDSCAIPLCTCHFFMWWTRVCWLGGGAAAVQHGVRLLCVGRHGAFNSVRWPRKVEASADGQRRSHLCDRPRPQLVWRHLLLLFLLLLLYVRLRSALYFVQCLLAVPGAGSWAQVLCG